MGDGVRMRRLVLDLVLITLFIGVVVFVWVFFRLVFFYRYIGLGVL